MNNVDMTNIVNETIESFKRMDGFNPDNVSDGYHTFGELYKHRIHLFIALCMKISNLSIYHDEGIKIIKSKLHSDGTGYDGWFIVQLETPVGQISYHLPNEYWDECIFIVTVDKANEWDGHDSDTVLERLLKI